MLRTSSAMIIAVAGLSLAGCGNQWANSWTDRTGEPQEAVRFDANGNKLYDPSVRNTSSDGVSGTGYANRGAWDSTNGRWTNEQTSAQHDMRSSGTGNRWTQDDRRSMRNDEQVWQKWNDRDMTMVRSSELPQPVLATFQRQADGGEMMDTGWANHDGKACYCTKAKKNGVTYKMVSDADGNLLAMKRID